MRREYPNVLVRGDWREMYWGLKKRSITLTALLLLGTVAALSTALIWLNYRDSMRAMRQHAVVYADSIGNFAEPGVLLNDPKALAHVVAVAIKNDAVCQAQIIDAKGSVLATRRRDPDFEPETLTDPKRPTAGKLQQGSAYINRMASQLAVVVPIWPQASALDLELLEEQTEQPSRPDGPIGYVALSYSLDTIDAEFVSRVVSVMIVGVIVIIVGAAVTILAIRQLLGPLKNLVETTHAIAHGDRSKRATERAVGEIGELARSFNYMADRLQESHDSVESIVEQRTAQLIKANRAKDNFLANMSHEIRTPITAITGFAESLLDPQLSEAERTGAIDTIRRNSDHLLNIVNDILDISKIGAGKLELERLWYSTVALVQEISSLMRARAESKGLSLKVEFLSDVPETIETDPTRLRQILINLVGNAIKFTDEGGVQMRVRFVEANHDAETPSPSLRFDVIDTGIGMTPEQTERAFKPFTQADETMSRRFGGTGLGLTISRHLAHMLGGEITFHSELHKGSTFSVSIATGSLDGVPLIHPQAQLPQATQRSPYDEAPASPAGSLACRVLLVEDGPDNQRLISFVLRKAGADVTVAENGQATVDAVMTAGQQPFDVILMDMQMPVLDGYAATSLLRRNGDRRPIIALTAHAMSTDREKCLTAGCNDYITKPINRKHLLRTVERYAHRPADGLSAPSVPMAQVEEG